MRIVVIGTAEELAGVKEKAGSDHEYVFARAYADLREMGSDAVFDFLFHRQVDAGLRYYSTGSFTVFVHSPGQALCELLRGRIVPNGVTFFRFNGLPGFISNTVFEIAPWPGNDAKLAAITKALGIDYVIVEDRAAMVTARIVMMIINEAYYTVQDGTASREDIDKAMKLGTNYPFGPFEWTRRIGVSNVYEVLSALFEETKDSRFKICPLLRKEYLSGGPQEN